MLWHHDEKREKLCCDWFFWRQMYDVCHETTGRASVSENRVCVNDMECFKTVEIPTFWNHGINIALDVKAILKIVCLHDNRYSILLFTYLYNPSQKET